MRILFIGDIYGRSGREALEKYLPTLKEKLSPDVVIVNAENSCHGRGITPSIAKGMFEWGADCLTGGNHIWGQKDIIPYIQNEKRLIRPINLPPESPGVGATLITLTDGRTIKVIHALGRVFMEPLDCPFRMVEAEAKKKILGQHVNAIFVDFHAEATSEKMAMGHFLDGRVTAVVGTHTHVPTADAHIMEKGTAYMTDAGMTGDYNSVIGAEKAGPVRRFTTKMPGERMTPAKGEGMLCGALIISDDNTGLAKSIEPVRMGKGLQETMPVL